MTARTIIPIAIDACLLWPKSPRRKTLNAASDRCEPPSANLCTLVASGTYSAASKSCGAARSTPTSPAAAICASLIQERVFWNEQRTAQAAANQASTISTSGWPPTIANVVRRETAANRLEHGLRARPRIANSSHGAIASTDIETDPAQNTNAGE